MFQNMEVVQSEKLLNQDMYQHLLELVVVGPIMVKAHRLRLTDHMV